MWREGKYQSGLQAFEQLQYARAASLFRECIDANIQAEQRSDAYLKLAFCHVECGDADAAFQTIRDYENEVSAGPQDPQLAQLRWMAKIADDLRDGRENTTKVGESQ